MEKKQSRVEELKKKAEASWEGCHGCNESDRDMWINGYIKGALANQIELPTYDKVTRLEVISENGRELVKYGVNVELQLQDEDRTLKVFTKIKGGDNE